MANDEIYRTSIQAPKHMVDVLQPYAKSKGGSLSSEFVSRAYDSMMNDPAFKVWAANERKKLDAGQATVIGRGDKKKPAAKKATKKR